MHNDRDYSQEEQQVNQAAGQMECCKAKYPQHKKNYE